MYQIITELGRMNRTFDTVEEAVEYGQQNLPNYMDWEVRDEEQDVHFTHYSEEDENHEEESC